MELLLVALLSVVLGHHSSLGLPVDHRQSGSCVRYTGQTCLHHMNIYGLVHIATNTSQDEIERKLNKYVHAVHETGQPGCRKVTYRVLCLYFFPPCRLTNSGVIHVLKTCREECKEYSKSLCSKIGFFIHGFNHGEDSYLRSSCFRNPSFSDDDGNEGCALLDVPDKQQISEEACRESHMNRDMVSSVLEEYPTTFNFKLFQNRHSAKHSGVVIKPFAEEIYEVILGRPYARPNSGSGKLFCTAHSNTLSAVLGVDANLTELSGIMPYPVNPSLKVPGYCFQFGEPLSNIASLVIPIGTLASVSIDPSLLLENMHVHVVKERDSLFLEGQGKYDFCGTAFDYTIRKNSELNSTVLTGNSSGSISVIAMELAYGLREMPSELAALTRYMKLFKLKLQSPLWISDWCKDERVVLFKGIGSLNEFGKTDIAAEVLIGGSRKYWSMKLAMKLDFVELISILGGTSNSKVGSVSYQALLLDKVWMFMSTSDVNVPVSMKESDLYKQFIQNKLTRGLIVNATGRIRPNCSQSLFCTTLKPLVGGNATFVLTANKTLDNLSLKIQFNDTRWNPNITLNEIKQVNLAWTRLDRTINSLRHTANVRVENHKENENSFSCNYKCRIQAIDLHFRQTYPKYFGITLPEVRFNIVLTAVKHRSKQSYLVTDFPFRELDVLMYKLDGV